MSRCVGILDSDPGFVVAHSKSVDIDATGRFLRSWDEGLAGDALAAHVRFRDYVSRDHECLQIFGLMRREVLAGTRLHGAYPDSDNVLLAEMALRGRLVDAPDEMFLRRQHDATSIRLFPRSADRIGYFDPTRAGQITFPLWRRGMEFFRSVHLAPLSASERWRCYWELRHWLARNWLRLLRNLGRGCLSLGPPLAPWAEAAPACRPEAVGRSVRAYARIPVPGRLGRLSEKDSRGCRGPATMRSKWGWGAECA